MDNQKKAPATKYQVRVSENAIENIDEIINYIFFVNQQPLNAIKMGDTMFDRIIRIALNSFLYKECELIPTQSKMYRQTLCLSWYIIYKIVAFQIIILGIIHKSQKPSKRKNLRKLK